MADPDSWESMADEKPVLPKPQPKLNPSAKPFVFNPQASAWTPSRPAAFAPPTAAPVILTRAMAPYQPPTLPTATVMAAPLGQLAPASPLSNTLPAVPPPTPVSCPPTSACASSSSSSTSPPSHVTHMFAHVPLTSPLSTASPSPPAAAPPPPPPPMAALPVSSSPCPPEDSAEDKQANSDASPVPSSAAPASAGASASKPSTTSPTPPAPAAEAEKPPEPRKKRKEVKRDPRPHLNIVFIGHVDAGKSTISGHLLYLTGMVDDRTLEKFEREAKQKNRESWKYAWAMDISEEERDRGKTHETGTGYFETKTRRYTILDAPGHKAFVPSMIGGACQADVGILVISAKKGEFESGFEKGGQTREHAILAKTAGVRQLLVAINKMDDPTVDWSEERYKEIMAKLNTFLKATGYARGSYEFIPISGLNGINLLTRMEKGTCPWWSGMSMLEFLDQVPIPELSEDEPVRFPIQTRFKDMGLMVSGTNHSGSFYVGDKLLMLPTKKEIVVDGILLENEEVEKCFPGDNVFLRVKGVDEDDIHTGFVLVDPRRPIPVCTTFLAQVLLLECKNIISAGYSCVLHVHAVGEEVTFAKLLCTLDKKTGEIVQKNPPFVKGGDSVLAKLETMQPVALEPFKVFSKMGRFMLRDEGKTIAVGVVTKISSAADAKAAGEK